MTTIFVSGSRKISRLNEEIRERLANIIDKEFSVIVGDANGSDKAIQTFFHERGYNHVTVYCSGQICRNNVGFWEECHISVDPKLTGRDFYTEKDKTMALEADYGLVLWDGKSTGSIRNVFEMVNKNKPVLLYFSPSKAFLNLRTTEDVEALLSQCNKEDVKTLSKKSDIKSFMGGFEKSHQMALAL
jgi:hypothetical protein